MRPSALRFEKTPRVIGDGLGSLPQVIDVDGDGDLDVVSAEYFATTGSFAWMERVEGFSAGNPNGKFARHPIDTASGLSIMMTFVPNLFGDGKVRAVGTNHTNTMKSPPDAQESAVFVFESGADPKAPWKKTQISKGIVSIPGSPFAPQGAPGAFATGDLDGDGDIDIAVSGDGDARIFWLEQTAPERTRGHGAACLGAHVAATADAQPPPSARGLRPSGC